MNLYDLLAEGLDPAKVLARLPPRDRKALGEAWAFWARPGQHWTPGPEFITMHEGGRGSGKAVSLDTPLATPTGWTTMGEVQVGDSLIDEQGRPCRVTATFDVDAKEAWRLFFSDGSHVDACGDHLWVTLDQLERKRMNRRLGAMMSMWAFAPPRTTREVVATLHRGARGDLNHCIPLVAPLALPDADLPVPPYVLGVWLGDGDSHSAAITSHVDDAVHYEARFTADGFTWERCKIDPSRPQVGRYVFGKMRSHRERSTCATARLRALGVWRNKHIPAIYLRASYKQRLALMQGLIDTDGTIDKVSGKVEFCTMLPHLAEQVAELARTLGQKPSISTSRAVFDGVDHGTKYRVFWRPTLPVASLPRKVALVQRMGDQSVRNMHRMITDAVRIDRQPMRCVTVDSPASMYLVGRGMIPTHNSWAARSAIFDAANNPDRWGGHAVIAGPDPTAVDSDMLHGLSGIVSTGTHLVEAGLIPRFVYNPSKLRLVFQQPRGGGSGLTVMIRASSNPKGGHGPNVGLAWFDEFGVWWHDKVDPAGKNFWRAIRPAIRAGNPDSKVIITLTPSRSPEVRIMQANSERPECLTCRASWLAANGGKYNGEALKEPWRLPRSPQPALHALLNTRSTVVERICPVCGGEVVAEVRTVFFDTRDNPMTDEPSRKRAAAELATNTTVARQTYAPRGEVDASVEGALVKYDDIRQVPHVAPEHSERGPGPVADRWAQALGVLGVDEVVVVVDPAVTATQGSDESGVVAAGLREVAAAKAPGGGPNAADAMRHPQGPGLVDEQSLAQVVGLQDWSVRPDEVDGAPSLVWAPRAYWLACLWGASRIVVETNQGGEEVLSAVRDLVGAPPSEAAVLARLRAEFVGVADARLASLARRVAQSARRIRVEHVHRRADKETRFEWYGRTAARQQQAVLCSSWLGGPQHWATTIAQVTGYEPPRPGATRQRVRKDRGDALVSAAQVLLRVTETHRGEVVEAAVGWMGKVTPRR